MCVCYNVMYVHARAWCWIRLHMRRCVCECVSARKIDQYMVMKVSMVNAGWAPTTFDSHTDATSARGTWVMSILAFRSRCSRLVDGSQHVRKQIVIVCLSFPLNPSLLLFSSHRVCGSTAEPEVKWKLSLLTRIILLIVWRESGKKIAGLCMCVGVCYNLCIY